MKRSKVMLLGFLAVLFVLISPLSVFGAEEPVTLKVFHTNDMHASIDDFGKMAAFLEAERAKVDHSLYLDAGDVSSGNPVVDLQGGTPIFTLLNAMKLDAMTIGNHEFDYGQEAFQSNKTLSNFPWLSANMTITDSSIPIDGVEPYHIFEFDGVKVGVLGLTEAPPATSPSGIVGLSFDNYLDTVTQYESLRDEVDILIGLNHVGIADDRRIAEATDFFDVIVGGHSHTQLDTPEMVNGTAIVQSGSNARNIGMLTLIFDSETKELTVEGSLQPVEALDDEVVDNEVQALVDGFNDASEELLSEVLGQTNTGLSREDRWMGDVQLGNMITDALRNFANTDIAITNNGGIRASIDPGDITAGDVFTVDPFGNVVTIVEMTGSELKEIIAYSYHRSLEDYGPQIDLQTSA
ncbi:bifunctional UDP-sugar hydrolase/5'-nucleotidase [Halolactibacillus sp. JCM 19043]|uniref:bifunctional metallophosphatase/5'-nucleotidase n=1 Tax=Halolactibacillus sp. JCM 19043 TaxID=1460638 RepID=UPI00078676F7|nr:bifunctional UDP-sugar hydrolase/5'-nucleotidase [Halolactibacillus sp. JCM 19043]